MHLQRGVQALAQRASELAQIITGTISCMRIAGKCVRYFVRLQNARDVVLERNLRFENGSLVTRHHRPRVYRDPLRADALTTHCASNMLCPLSAVLLLSSRGEAHRS